MYFQHGSQEESVVWVTANGNPNKCYLEEKQLHILLYIANIVMSKVGYCRFTMIKFQSGRPCILESTSANK